MPDIQSFVADLPKVELHLHLVGSASVETVLELARRHPDAGVPTEPAALARYYEFRDFPHFLDVYGAVSGLVRTGADVVALVVGLARDAARSNVRYAEVTVTVNPISGRVSNRTSSLMPSPVGECLRGRATASTSTGSSISPAGKARGAGGRPSRSRCGTHPPASWHSDSAVSR
jgi:hypothetical protein